MLNELEHGNLEFRDIAKLNAAYHAALIDARGRPEWRKVLGAAEMRNIIARVIVDKSVRNSQCSVSSLSKLAIEAIKTRFLSSRDPSAFV